MTFELEGDLNILKMYLHTENEIVRSRQPKAVIMDDICMAILQVKYENSS